MEEKKEIQRKILNETPNLKATEDELFSILKIISPGTHFRSALDGALKIGKGALIVIENSSLMPLIDGGFRLNAKFSPQRLMELTKLDGAIILSKDLKRINYANVTLTPSAKIKTNETGTRHKAAERTAKQTGALTIAISERRKEITVFYKNIRYALKTTPEILRKASEKIQLLEKQKDLFDKNTDLLNKLELNNYFSLYQAIQVIQKGKIISNVCEELRKPIIELGKEGTLIKLRVKEISSGVEKETNYVIKDYTKTDMKKTISLLEEYSYEELSDDQMILKALSYDENSQRTPIPGWRILSKTNLSESEIASIILDKKCLKDIINPQNNFPNQLDDEKSHKFLEEMKKIKINQGLF